jgi:hypothetical protein
MIGHNPHHDFRKDIWIVAVILAAVIIYVVHR